MPPSWIKNYQLFLFDFDGLLVDTEMLHYAAYRELCARRGFELNWEFEQYYAIANGKSFGVWDGIARDFPQMLERESRDALYSEKKAIYVEALQSADLMLMPGAEELLLQLAAAGVKRAVATNSPRHQIELISERLPVLKTISHWVTREDYAQAKPAPDSYLKAINALAASGDRIIGFEDSLKGLKALVAAGIDKPVLICPSHMSHVSECTALGAEHSISLAQFAASQA